MPLVPQNIIDLKPYVPGKPIEEVQKEFGLDYVVKLASNENPMGLSPRAAQAIIASLHSLNRYPNIGSIELREKISEVYNVPVKNIATGSGSEGIMSTIMRTFTFNDEEAITADGSFIGFYVITNARGMKMHKLPLKDYAFDLNTILDAINSKTKIIYLANPNNPTGTIFNRKEFEAFHKEVPDNVLIILDEAYYEFARLDPDYPDSLDYRFDNVISLRTFSKAYGIAGIRIGYGFAQEDIVANIFKTKLPFEPSITAQMAGLAALDDKEFVRQYIDLNKRGLEFFYDTFTRLGIKYVKSHANFVLIDVESSDRVQSLTDKLLRKGVIVRPLAPYGLPTCMRISTGLDEENEIFAKAFEEVL